MSIQNRKWNVSKTAIVLCIVAGVAMFVFLFGETDFRLPPRVSARSSVKEASPRGWHLTARHTGNFSYKAGSLPPFLISYPRGIKCHAERIEMTCNLPCKPIQ